MLGLVVAHFLANYCFFFIVLEDGIKIYLPSLKLFFLSRIMFS